MNKYVIVTSGRENLLPILSILKSTYGYDCLAYSPSPLSVLSGVVEDVSTELNKYMHFHAQNVDRNEYEWIKYMFSMGGRAYLHSKYFDYLFDRFMVVSGIQTKGMFDFANTLLKSNNCKAVLVHESSGAYNKTMMKVAQSFGIPTFNCDNGLQLSHVCKYSGLQPYCVANVDLISGEYIKDWIEFRRDTYYNITDDYRYEIVGNPAFDKYYALPGETVKKPNVFLYSVATTPHIIEGPSGSAPYMIDVHPTSFCKTLIPSIDNAFIEAFIKYQTTINPDARLWVSCKPYSIVTANIMKNFIAAVGAKNIEVFAYEDVPFYRLLQQASYLISPPSTVLIEGIITRTPTMVLINEVTSPSIFYIGHEQKSPKTVLTSLPDAKSIYENLQALTDDIWNTYIEENAGEEAKYFNYNDDGIAAWRAVDKIIERIE